MNPSATRPAPVALAPAAEACPRCRQPLVDPSGLGWCKACGYCKSLEDGPAAAVPLPNADTAPAPRGALIETGALVGGIPGWFWATLVVAASIAAASYALSRSVEMTPLRRATLASLMLAAGLGVMFAGQLIALIRIAPFELTLSLKDALLPFRLYGLMVKHLSHTRVPLALVLVGASLALSGVLLVGGLSHWMTYLPGRENNPTRTRRA